MFKNEVAEFIYKRTYSRWIEEESRREDWPETIERFIGFIISERPDIPEKTVHKIRKYMTEFAVMPSMRFLWAAGDAAKKDEKGKDAASDKKPEEKKPAEKKPAEKK